MAHIVPSLDRIDHLPTPVAPGTRALVEVLLDVLTEEWTIYVQPFLNGPTPELFLFSEESGLAIIATRDWNLDHYRVTSDGRWEELTKYDGEDHWHSLTGRCPFQEVHYHRRSVLQYILPALQAEIMLDPNVNWFFSSFVYFHNATAVQALQTAAPFLRSEQHQYVQVLGGADLNPDKLGRLLTERNSEQKRLFRDMMQRNQMHAQLRRNLAERDYPRIDLSDIQHSFSPQLEKLRPNAPGRRWAQGAAGSGKSLLLVRKAVDAAIAGKKVLVVCYNITMTNYLNEMIRALVHYDHRADEACNRRILVRHFHRLFPDTQTLKDQEVLHHAPFDVILIDEGQDFHGKWMGRLYALESGPDAHMMFVEDERQNIYGVEPRSRRILPGFKGRPNSLCSSYRVNRDIAALANFFIKLSHRKFDSPDIESELPDQPQLGFVPRPVWYEGSPDQLLDVLGQEIERLNQERGAVALAQTSILVCTVSDGQEVCKRLDDLGLEYDRSFESSAEREQVRERHKDKGPEKVQWRLDELRRGRKLAFRPDSQRLKVCTIHSFKGWEMERTFIYFRPQGEPQFDTRVPLLYTAMTRAKQELTIFNAEPNLSVLGERAAAAGLLDLRRPAQSNGKVVAG